MDYFTVVRSLSKSDIHFNGLTGWELKNKKSISHLVGWPIDSIGKL